MMSKLPTIKNNHLPSSVYYIDRSHNWVTEDVYQDENLKNQLMAHCADVKYERRSRLRKPALHLSQPTQQAFQILNARDGIGEVFYIEVVKDILTKSYEDAKKIQQFELAHRIEGWRGNKITGQCESTEYSSNIRSSQKNTARYSDRTSKITGTFCYHEERRINYKSAIIAEGLTLENLAQLDEVGIADWWNKRPITYYRVDFEKLARRRLKLTKREGRLWIKSEVRVNKQGKIIYHQLQRAGAFILREAQYKYYERQKYKSDLLLGTKNLQRTVDAITKVLTYKKEDYLVVIPPPDYL